MKLKLEIGQLKCLFKKEVGGFVEVNELVNVIQKDLVPQANKKKCAKSSTI